MMKTTFGRRASAVSAAGADRVRMANDRARTDSRSRRRRIAVSLMFRIDALTLTDLPGALRLSAQAGWNQIDADWRRLVDLWPATCLAGRDDDGQLIATATLAVY